MAIVGSQLRAKNFVSSCRFAFDQSTIGCLYIRETIVNPRTLGFDGSKCREGGYSPQRSSRYAAICIPRLRFMDVKDVSSQRLYPPLNHSLCCTCTTQCTSVNEVRLCASIMHAIVFFNAEIRSFSDLRKNSLLSSLRNPIVDHFSQYFQTLSLSFSLYFQRIETQSPLTEKFVYNSRNTRIVWRNSYVTSM